MYRPLREELEIKNSKVHGQGVFAKQKIIAGYDLGNTHIYRNKEIHRTPLGGFLNHSDIPNCFIIDNAAESVLYTVRPINKGEELTVYYRKYDV